MSAKKDSTKNLRAYDSERVSHLADLIVKHKRVYYAGKPEISDAEYDKLEDELRRLSPDHPALRIVGTEISSGAERKVEHSSPMLSLQKTYEVSDLASWMNDQPVVGMHKVDGNSLSLVYQDGSFVMAKTRGNGRVGEDVTEKAKWVPDILPKLRETRGTIEIRGELYCTESQFALLSNRMIERGLERPTNPRNIVAGFLGRKTHLDLASHFNFFAFDVITNNDLFTYEIDKFAWLEDQGFRVPFPVLIEKTSGLEDYLESVKRAMNEDEIGLDGAVFSYNDLKLHHELGMTSHHPRYKMSFKWQGETATARIASVLWSTSRRGIVTPVAVIDPVFLSGASITNVTLHNAAHVKSHNIKAGDLIEIVRSGEVIPKFLGVVTSVPGMAVLPDKCPSCNSSLVFDEVRLACTNPACPAQRMLSIINWIRAVEIDDLSEKRLIPLIEKGLVGDIPDLYRLSKQDFFAIPQTKEKMATKLFNNIQASKNIPLARFLLGLGIEGAGLTSWEKLIDAMGSLKAIRNARDTDITSVEGFAEKSANQIVSGLSLRSKLIDELLEVGVSPTEPSIVSTKEGLPLSGLTFVITGALSKPRSVIEGEIKAAGGKIAASVSKQTHAVITEEPDSNSSKMKKARELGIAVWSENELESFLGR